MNKYVFLPGLAVSGLILGMATGASAGDTGFYVEAGGSYGAASDLKEVFTSATGKTTWETDEAIGAKLQFGWDFGDIRSDLKLKVYESGIDSVGGAAVTREDYYFGSATINVYYDIYEFGLGGDLALTPFVGLGVGAAGGYANATRVSDSARGEQMAGVGPAGAWAAGVLFNVTESIGFTLGYDGLATGGGSEVYYSHSGELGIRFTF